MKGEGPTVVFAVRTAKGERRRIRSFLKQIEELGVEIEDLPPASVKALTEADKFLGRYIDLLAHETPNPEQLEGVIEALGGIDRVVKNAMAEVLKSLGWRPEKAQSDGDSSKSSKSGAPSQGRPPAKGAHGARSERGKIIQFPGPRPRKTE